MNRFEEPIRILSDLHLAHPGSRIVNAAQLAPLLDGVKTLIFNGDTSEERMKKYREPAQAQLDALDKAKMPVICHQNEVGLKHKGNTIVAWMHGDEPDNAQGRRLRGYKPPIPPHEVVEGFEAMRKLDKRPVPLNLG